MISESMQQCLADTRELVDAWGVPFAVIGGLCALLRGEPRFTADIDLVIAAEPDAALHLLDAARHSPFQPLLEDAAEFARQAYLLPLHHARTGITVDVSFGATGFEQQLIERAELESLGNVRLPVATAEDLILLKLIAGRPRDVEDVNGVVLRHAGTLDWDYMLTTGAGLQAALSQDIIPHLERLRTEL